MSERVIASRYILNEPLGQGAMGIVFRAEDRLTGDLVALKQVLPPGARAPSSPTSDLSDPVVALASEFRILAGLRHPNIVSVLDYGVDHQMPFFTMQLLENTQSLTEYAV